MIIYPTVSSALLRPGVEPQHVSYRVNVISELTLCELPNNVVGAMLYSMSSTEVLLLGAHCVWTVAGAY